MSDSFKETIWTDNERARFIIWQAYEGFIEHYENYLMYKSMKQEHPIIRAGLVRYAVRFYEETRLLVMKFLDKDDQVKLIGMFETTDSYRLDDFRYMRRIFHEFMHKSGLANIIMTKDYRSNYERAGDKYHK